MIENFPLPPELEGLERLLAARERRQPPPEMKQRLLFGVRAELHRSQDSSRWAFAVAVAATVLVWLNLSLCATQATDCGLALRGPHQPVEDQAEQIRQLLPDLPPREAMRQAVLLRAATGVTPCPRLSGNYVALGKSDAWKQLMN